jgi:hypothetical protein
MEDIHLNSICIYQVLSSVSCQDIYVLEHQNSSKEHYTLGGDMIPAFSYILRQNVVNAIMAIIIVYLFTPSRLQTIITCIILLVLHKNPYVGQVLSVI